MSVVSFSVTVINQKIPSASIRREFSSTFPLDDAEGCGDRRLVMASRLTEESGFLRKVHSQTYELIMLMPDEGDTDN